MLVECPEQGNSRQQAHQCQYREGRTHDLVEVDVVRVVRQLGLQVDVGPDVGEEAGQPSFHHQQRVHHSAKQGLQREYREVQHLVFALLFEDARHFEDERACPRDEDARLGDDEQLEDAEADVDEFVQDAETERDVEKELRVDQPREQVL